MRDLLPSGRFAQLARLSRKALRLYAEQGLLRPVYTNPDSGYHYYSFAQLEDARRITTLRELEMPLDAIQDALKVWNTADLAACLDRHRDHLRRQAERAMGALDTLERLVRQPQPAYSVHTRTAPPQPYWGLRGWCPPEDACRFVAQAQRVLAHALDTALLAPQGAALARYHEEQEERWDIEVCVPTQARQPAPPAGPVYAGELPGGLIVATVHAGDYGGPHGMQGAYAATWRWLREHGHEPLGGPGEVYLFDDTNTADPADYRTEIFWHVRPD